MDRFVHARQSAWIASVAIGAVVGVTALFAHQTPKKADASAADIAAFAARLTGTWRFDNDLSTGAIVKTTPDDGAGQPSDPGRARGAGNGGYGGSPGGYGGPTGFGASGYGVGRGGFSRDDHEFSQSEETRRVDALRAEVSETPQTLTIKATATTVEIAPDDRDARAYSVRNAKEKVDLILARVDVTSAWRNGALVQEFDAGSPMKLSVTYAMTTDGKHVSVTLVVTKPKNQGGVGQPFTRVYDRVPAHLSTRQE